jgi:hypothetical protein
MRRLILLLSLFSLPLISDAQYKWDVGAKLGAANYLGDIGGGKGTRKDFVLDMKMPETRQMLGLFARYRMFPNISVQFGLDYMHIQGDDKLTANKERKDRNLNFQNNIYELNLMAQYYFYEINDLGHTYRYRNDFRAYAGIGVAGFHMNPKTLDGGIPLQPLETENVKYSLYQFSIPAQLGFYFTVNKRYRIGWDLTWRTTFTDYLDDVHGKYVNPVTQTPQAAALANRTNELNISQADKNNYGWFEGKGNKRGDATHNDSYMSTSINFSYTLRGKSTFYKSSYGSVFKSHKYKKRKFRAKF